jgi:hypothetical protein
MPGRDNPGNSSPASNHHPAIHFTTCLFFMLLMAFSRRQEDRYKSLPEIFP